MPIIAHYHCPRCGELFTPLMRIEWASVAPCHACHAPIRISKSALAQNCMVCVMVYATLTFLPIATVYVLVTGEAAGFGWNLFAALSLAMIGAALVGMPAGIIGFFMADRRPMSESTEPAAAICSICGAILHGGERSAGLCKDCRNERNDRGAAPTM